MSYSDKLLRRLWIAKLILIVGVFSLILPVPWCWVAVAAYSFFGRLLLERYIERRAARATSPLHYHNNVNTG